MTTPQDRQQAIDVMTKMLVQRGLDQGDAVKAATELVDRAIKFRQTGQMDDSDSEDVSPPEAARSEAVRIGEQHIPGTPYHYRHGWIPVAPYFKTPGDLRPGDVVLFRGHKHLVLPTPSKLGEPGAMDRFRGRPDQVNGVFLHPLAPQISAIYPTRPTGKLVGHYQHFESAAIHGHDPMTGGGFKTVAAGPGRELPSVPPASLPPQDPFATPEVNPREPLAPGRPKPGDRVRLVGGLPGGHKVVAVKGNEVKLSNGMWVNQRYLSKQLSPGGNTAKGPITPNLLGGINPGDTVVDERNGQLHKIKQVKNNKIQLDNNAWVNPIFLRPANVSSGGAQVIPAVQPVGGTINPGSWVRTQDGYLHKVDQAHADAVVLVGGRAVPRAGVQHVSNLGVAPVWVPQVGQLARPLGGDPQRVLRIGDHERAVQLSNGRWYAPAQLLPEHGKGAAPDFGRANPNEPVPPVELHPEGEHGKVTVVGRIVTPEAVALRNSMKSGIARSEHLGGGVQAETSIVHFKDGTKAVRKVFGPGKDGNGNDKSSLCDAEFLAAQVAEAIGGTGCPPVVRGRGKTDYMGWAGDDAQMAIYGPALDKSNARVPRIGLLDIVIGNTDRHVKNYMVNPDGSPVPIDNSSSFGMQGGGWKGPFRKELEQMVSEGRSPFTTSELDDIHQRIESLRPQFVSTGRKRWLDETLRRLDRFKSANDANESVGSLVGAGKFGRD